MLDFREAAEILEHNADKLDEAHLVQLAIALEGLGDAEKALEVLERGGSRGKPADMPVEAWLQLLGYFDAVNFAPEVKCPVILGLGLRDDSLSPAPGTIAAYAYLPGERAIVASPWEGHCYPPKLQTLRKTAWEGFVAGR